jgi:hypothetical protein
MSIFRRACREIWVNVFGKRNPPNPVPEVGEPSVNETRLGRGIDADSGFSYSPGKVVLKVLFELLLVPHVPGDIGHHYSSIAYSLMLVIDAHSRSHGRLEGVLRVRVSKLRLGPVELVFSGRK